jgi:hypothetical protein
MGLSKEVPDVRYIVLWLFPTCAFRHIACWPGYSWFEASGHWVYGNGLIHCRGQQQSFSDAIAHECPDIVTHICNPGTDRNYTVKTKSSKKGLPHPHTSAYRPTADGQELTSVEAPVQTLARLSPNQLGPLFSLQECGVSTRWQDFESLMFKIERQLKAGEDKGEPTSRGRTKWPLAVPCSLKPLGRLS